jgi:signal peptidase I
MSLTVEPSHRRTADTPADPAASQPARPVVSAVRWGGRVVAWLVILASLAALTVAVLVPRLGGATPYEILTGSMRPGLPPGTLVVMKPAGPGDIGVGSVVTYQLRSGEPTVVTHRVVEVRQSLSGEVEYVTQGDANSVPDQDAVRPEQIRGTLWYAVPHLGRVNQLINGDQRQSLVYLAAAGLGAYALAMYAAATRDRRRRSQAHRA